MFLLAGEVLLSFEAGGTLVVVGGSDETRHALNRRKETVAEARAITDVDLLVLEDDLLDILATWDQVAASGRREMAASGAFSLSNLRTGVFAPLPAAVDELSAASSAARARAARSSSARARGDYYYVIESGAFQVSRHVGARVVAELKTGMPSAKKRWFRKPSATPLSAHLTDARLLRLDRRHFDELLREPLLRGLDYAEAFDKVRRGALWLDEISLGVPVRQACRRDQRAARRSEKYVRRARQEQEHRLTDGRRSAAAAFLRAAGFKGMASAGWRKERESGQKHARKP